MKKKKEAVGKYFADLLRTIGTALVLFAGLGLAFGRKEALANLPLTVACCVIGGVFIFSGVIVVLISTLET